MHAVDTLLLVVGLLKGRQNVLLTGDVTLLLMQSRYIIAELSSTQG
jgi:hypothetical protein